MIQPFLASQIKIGWGGGTFFFFGFFSPRDFGGKSQIWQKMKKKTPFFFLVKSPKVTNTEP